MRRAAFRRKVLLAGAVFAALLPVLTAGPLMERAVVQRERDILGVRARDALARAEARLGAARAALEAAVASGATTCSAEHIARMHTIASATRAIDQVGLIAADGALLCSQHGFDSDHAPMTAEQLVPDGQVALAIVRAGEARAPALRLRAVAGPPNLAVTVPVPELVPDHAGDTQPGVESRVVLAGMPFVSAGMPADLAPHDLERTAVSPGSLITVDLVRTRAAVRAESAGALATARSAALLTSLAGLGLIWWLWPRRSPSLVHAGPHERAHAPPSRPLRHRVSAQPGYRRLRTVRRRRG